MTTLESRPIAILKTITERLGTVQRGCFCEAGIANFGDLSRKCMNCLVVEARAAIAEATNSPELPDCSTCGRPDPENIAVSVDFEGTRTAQCRACYVAAREREMAGVGS